MESTTYYLLVGVKTVNGIVLTMFLGCAIDVTNSNSDDPRGLAKAILQHVGQSSTVQQPNVDQQLFSNIRWNIFQVCKISQTLCHPALFSKDYMLNKNNETHPTYINVLSIHQNAKMQMCSLNPKAPPKYKWFCFHCMPQNMGFTRKLPCLEGRKLTKSGLSR